MAMGSYQRPPVYGNGLLPEASCVSQWVATRGLLCMAMGSYQSPPVYGKGGTTKALV